MSRATDNLASSEMLLWEFDRNALMFLDTLDRMHSLVSILDQERTERVRRDVEQLRLDALATEFREAVPDIEPDYELLKLVGSNPAGSAEEDKIRLRQALEERF